MGRELVDQPTLPVPPTMLFPSPFVKAEGETLELSAGAFD